jgi:DNA-binding winged helix-turn-helix (wHTH) protein
MGGVDFGPFTFDLGTRQLTRAGRPIHLSPKAFDLLAVLIQGRPAALSKMELQQRLWPGTFVVEANLSNLMAEVRAALEDSSREPVYVRTIHSFGYAFCADAHPRVDGATPPPSAWLVWGGKRFPLPPGDHIVGREAEADVRIESSTVSRRHACLRVTGDGIVLEDFGSKNGTYRGDDRVVAPVRLADGDRLRIGSEQVVFRVRSENTTETHTGDRT